MPLFLTPLPASSTTRHSQPSTFRNRLSASRPQRKRKHSSEEETDSSSSSASSSEDDRPDAATNPLSLTPDEIAQYRLAGLSLDKPLPRSSGWPHRGLPARLDPKAARRRLKAKGKGKGSEQYLETEEEVEEMQEEEEEEEQSKENSPHLRLQHLAVLTTILHRCLLEGDIKRAGRAWGLMLRMQIGGKGIDLRGTNYWVIGAELLIRSMDGQKREGSYDFESESVVERNQHDEEARGRREGTDEKGRWGTAIGLQRAKDYYERLIIEHPFKRQFSGSVSALDFWPCMVACEIYGVQYEQSSSLQRLQKLEEQDIDDFHPGEVSDSEEEDEENGNLGNFEVERRSKERKKRKKDQNLWQEREKVRQIALTASSQIAARLDERMTVPPYSDSHDLLRLRGMLALYIGDLSVPAKPEENEQEGEEEGRGRRLLMRQRVGEYERGLRGREEQWQRARVWFRRIERNAGDLSGIPDSLLDVEEPEAEMTGADSE